MFCDEYGCYWWLCVYGLDKDFVLDLMKMLEDFFES